MPYFKIYIKGKDTPLEYYEDSEAIEFVKQKLDEKFAPLKEFAKKAWGGMSPFDKAALATAPLPVIGDITGLVADADMFINDPESRTLLNVGLSAAGLIPFVPALSITSKLNKANEMDLDVSKKFYHGTRGDIEEFDPAKFGTSTGSESANEGVWLTDSPKEAGEYATVAAGGKGGESVYPLYTSQGDYLEIDVAGKKWKQAEGDIDAAIIKAKDKGYKGIDVKNIRDSPLFTAYSGAPTNHRMVFSPDDVKSTMTDFPADLPTMDEASRMERAKEMGFYTEMPAYHGTNKDFEAFDLFEGEDPSRSVSRSPVGKLGVSLALDPKLANEFASRAGGEGMNVIPALHRAKNPVSIDLDGTETNNEIFSTVTDAWKQGFDSIKFNNYTTDAGGSGQSFVLVKDPNQVRSINAAFDPDKKMSPNLLAGAAGATLVGSAALNGEDDDI